MSKHTKGPWFKNEYRQILGGSGQRIYVDGFAFGSHSTEESQANDRRIVACVNTCEGFSIEELEGANLFDDSVESRKEIIALKQQQDKLMEALIGLLGEAEAIAQVIPAYGESQNIKNARAAIAEAVGDTSPECKCDFRQKTVGDGCDICNPELASDYAMDTAAKTGGSVNKYP